LLSFGINPDAPAWQPKQQSARVSYGGIWYSCEAALEEARTRVEDPTAEWEKAREHDGWSLLVARFGVETEEVSW
jgi:hypothetical protein